MANINFIKYPSIESYDKTNRNVGVFKEENVFNQCDWLVCEKIHGAHFSFITNGYSIAYAKRSGEIKFGEDFFGYQRVVEKYKYSVVNLWKEMSQLGKIRGSDNQIIVYGELFGGHYPNSLVEQTAGVNPVQKGVYYCPDIEWKAFDIHDGKGFLEWDTMIGLLQSSCLPFIRELTRGPFLKCKGYDPNFNTLIPQELGLPYIGFDNKAEGIVIRPLKNIEVKKIGRVMFKLKIKHFDERIRTANANSNSTGYSGTNYPYSNMNLSSYEKKEKLPIKPDMFLSFININRLESVISKEGNLTRENEGKFAKLLFEDAMKDIKKCKEMGKKFLFTSKEKKEETRHLLFAESKKMVEDFILAQNY